MLLVEVVFWITGEGGVVVLFLVTGEDVGAVSLGAGVLGFVALGVSSVF